MRFSDQAASLLKIRESAESLPGGLAFRIAASRVIPVVSSFCENFIARLLGGEVVSHDADYAELADVYVKNLKMSLQVKGSNRMHDGRASLEQVDRLYRQVTSPFWDPLGIREGVYAVVFYKGDNGDGRSLLIKRGMSNERKQMIIAEGIQCVYILDVRFVQHLSTQTDFESLRTNGKSKVWADRKVSSQSQRYVLRFKRGFLHPMVEAPELPAHYRTALDAALGVSGWKIREEHVNARFNLKGSSMTRSVPVRIIGGNKTVKMVLRTLGKKERFTMDLSKKEPKLAL